MSIRFGALLLAMPIMISGAHAAPAPSNDAGDHALVITAPASDHAAAPAGCNGCVGGDCANCPLHAAMAAAKDGPAATSELPCKSD